MIDINLIRENPDLVKENIKKKFQNEKIELVDKIRALDCDWRNLKNRVDKLRHERNKISKEIAETKRSKNSKKEKTLMKEAKLIPSKIQEIEKKSEKIYNALQKNLEKIPNIISKNTPIGKDDSENKVSLKQGKPKKQEVKSHVEIAEELGLADFDSSARVSGNGFYYLQGDLALLNQALIRLAIDVLTKKGFQYIETPLMLREEIIDKVTDLNDKEQQIYLIENEKLALIGTSEHSLIGRFANQTIPESKLPIKQTSYSMCFRKEIGSHGVDEKGLFRTHQFNKVEMITICHPEESEKFFKELQNITLEIFKKLEIPVRVLRICSGDLGDLKYEQVDIEAYSPRKKDYFEVGSCSNLTEAQARKLKISATIKGKRIIPHTLNNTAIATSRALVAILENHQTPKGEIRIPKALQKYMNNKKTISKN